MLHPNEITGVVLAGGKSSRFGSNKALCKYGDGTFLEHIATLLRPYVREVVVSGYYPEYESAGFPVLKDTVPEAGPLGGIYTALTQSTTPGILVLACDMPFITGDIIGHTLTAGRGEDAIGWTRPDNKVMFPLLLSRNILPQLEKAIANNQYRVKQIFDWQNTRRIAVPDEWEYFFANINRPEEYKNPI